jgi:GDPmannose 4,6-dehydratase
MRKALIFGISGQDGSYLAKLLLSKNYKVYGVSRDRENCDLSKLKYLDILSEVEIMSGTVGSFDSVVGVLGKVDPDEIYNLSGESSVSLSFKYPVATLESIVLGTQNLLDGIRRYNPSIRLFSPCSTECFGDTGNDIADESTTFRPRSPYSIAKSAAFWQVSHYRDAYGIFACSGIMSNHESPLRPTWFVTQKIISTACRIYNGSEEVLYLGNLDVERDWGWAPDYVEAMWLMLQQSSASDFIIATGQSTSLKTIVKKIFSHLDLDYMRHLSLKEGLLRPTDFRVSRVSPEKAKVFLGWHAKVNVDSLISNLIHSKLRAELPKHP